MCVQVKEMLKFDSPHPAAWKSAECSWDTLLGRAGQSGISPCHHPGLSPTDRSGEGSSHGPWSHNTTREGNKETISRSNHKYSPNKGGKWIWPNLYNWESLVSQLLLCSWLDTHLIIYFTDMRVVSIFHLIWFTLDKRGNKHISPKCQAIPLKYWQKLTLFPNT